MIYNNREEGQELLQVLTRGVRRECVYSEEPSTNFSPPRAGRILSSFYFPNGSASGFNTNPSTLYADR